MRFDLRLHGRLADGRRCIADVSVYANGAEDLKREAYEAAANAAWHFDDDAPTWVADNSSIVVEHVTLLTETLDREGTNERHRLGHPPQRANVARRRNVATL
jgi:hypothetical protein